jgi:complement component 1 Q subcomponent-binding protein
MMNGIVKTALKLSTFRGITAPLRATLGKREFTRTLWHMSQKIDGHNMITKPSQTCSCGCGIQRVHTKSERELVEFLAEEIVAERKAQKVKNVPTELDGFKVKLDGAEIELRKESEKEKILISFNVNHTVDADEEAEIEQSMDKPNFAEMKSKPTFEIDIVRGGKTLSFTCSFLQAGHQAEEQDGYNDIFGIDEITIYDGEWTDKTYAVAGDVLDGYLYDLLMNLLEEKGISNEFVEKLANLSTSYEHTSYIGLLESLSKFTVGGK